MPGHFRAFFVCDPRLPKTLPVLQTPLAESGFRAFCDMNICGSTEYPCWRARGIPQRGDLFLPFAGWKREAPKLRAAHRAFQKNRHTFPPFSLFRRMRHVHREDVKGRKWTATSDMWLFSDVRSDIFSGFGGRLSDDAVFTGRRGSKGRRVSHYLADGDSTRRAERMARIRESDEKATRRNTSPARRDHTVVSAAISSGFSSNLKPEA